mgnify:CR=1 FL=1
MNTGDGLEQCLFIQRMALSSQRKLIGKYIKKNFGVAGRIDMTTVQFI